MSELISVIIPAYNASEWILRALESVCAQYYRDFEIVLVDDASSDDTASIAGEYLETSGVKFQILRHEHNRGASSARNTGLAASQGKYIAFMDSDDILRSNFLSALYELCADHECDISFCGLTDRFTENIADEDKIHSPKKWGIYSGEELIIGRNIPAYVCCLYRKSFLDEYGLCFHDGCTSGEDTEFQAKAFCRAERITFTTKCLYIYIHHKGMGSVSDNDTRRKKIIRYESNTHAQERTAEYLAKYASTGELMNIVQDILIPQIAIRKTTIHIMRKDKEGYMSSLQDDDIRSVLTNITKIRSIITSVKSMSLRRLEIMFKALMLVYLPRIYYFLREKV